MKIASSQILDAPPSVIYLLLNDEDNLALCIPGCQSLARLDENNFEGLVEVKIGPVKALFKGIVNIDGSKAPHYIKLRGEGKGGIAGFAKGIALMNLEPETNGRSSLSYELDFRLGGKIATMGARLINSVVKQLAKQFFANFAEVVEDYKQNNENNYAVEDHEIQQSTDPKSGNEEISNFKQKIGKISSKIASFTEHAREEENRRQAFSTPYWFRKMVYVVFFLSLVCLAIFWQIENIFVFFNK